MLFALALTSACSGGLSTALPGDGSGFAESATAGITPVGGKSVQTTLTIQNDQPTAQTLRWSIDCGGFGAVVVRAYRVSGSTRTLVWRSDALPRQLGCASQLLQRTLNPGDQLSLNATYSVAAILGDSLPAGTYAITAAAATSPALTREADAGLLALSAAVADPPASTLAGDWRATTHGVAITLTLRWTADSVTGSGTYSVSPASTLGCGGGTLTGSGTVRLAAARAKDQVSGGMQFSNGWTPPFLAVLVDPNTLGGFWMSIDAGPCLVTFAKPSMG
jgi:hypothetical protein